MDNIMDCCNIYNPNKVPNKWRRYRDCRVKFGVPLEQVCKRDIPGPLLVSILYCFFIEVALLVLAFFWVEQVHY